MARTPRADIIDSVDVPIIAVRSDRTVSRFNSSAATLLSLTPANLGRPLREIPVLQDVKRLEELCGEAIASGASSQCEVRDATNGSWFILRIAPYMESEHQPGGAVLTLQNVTAFRASLEQAIYEREYTKVIINTVIDPLVVLDDDCRVQAANQAFHAMFQVSREQAQGAKLYEIGSRDWEIPRLQRLLKETHDNNESDAIEFEHEFPALGRRTVLLNARRLSRAGNLGRMILLTIQDITERKRVEMVTASLAAIVESSDDAIIGKDLNSVITSWNKGAERLFGYTAQEAIGHSITMLIPPDRRQEEPEIIARLVRGERVDHFETVRVRKDGMPLEISLTVSPVKDSAGRIIGASKIARDITARKRVDEALRNHTAQYETLLNQAPLGVFLVDGDFRIRQINPVAFPLFGNIPDLIGRDFDEVIHLMWTKEYADEIVRKFRRTLETGEPYETPERAEYRIDRGLIEYYEWHINRISLPESGYGVVCYFRDISAQVRARSVLAESEERFRILAESLEVAVRDRTQELEQRNADLQMQSERLRDVSMRLLQAQDDERRNIARNLHDSAGQILAALAMNVSRLAERARQESPWLVDDVADSDALVQQLSREIRTTSYLLHPPLLEETGLAGALRWYIDGARERSGLDIQLRIPKDFERLPVDMELVIFRLVQECLTNIHRHSGGKAATVRISREANGLCLEVQDDGKGIPPDKLSKIRSQGLGGVGISGMRERVRQFDGQLNIESNGSGTTISARFPFMQKSASLEESK